MNRSFLFILKSNPIFQLPTAIPWYRGSRIKINRTPTTRIPYIPVDYAIPLDLKMFTDVNYSDNNAATDDDPCRVKNNQFTAVRSRLPLVAAMYR